MKQYEEDGFLLTASTQGEDRWTEGGEPDEELSGLIPGHSYTILQIKEFKNNKLVKLRNPWGSFEWYLFKFYHISLTIIGKETGRIIHHYGPKKLRMKSNQFLMLMMEHFGCHAEIF